MAGPSWAMAVGFSFGDVNEGDALHLSVRGGASAIARTAEGRNRHFRTRAAHLLGRRSDRSSRRLAQDLRRAILARPCQWLCRVLHQYAGTDPDLLPLFRAA